MTGGSSTSPSSGGTWTVPMPGSRGSRAPTRPPAPNARPRRVPTRRGRRRARGGGGPNGLGHWETSGVVPDVTAATEAVQRGKFQLISAAPVQLPDTALGFSRGILVRDPDGHVVQLIEREGEVHAQH